MRTNRLSDALVKAIPVPDKGRNVVYEEDIRGLCVRVYSTGKRSFFLRTYIQGHDKTMKIGDYPTWPVAAARKRAQELKQQIDRGEDPKAKKQEERAAPRVRDLYDRYSHAYFEGRAKGYVKDQKRYWKQWILPELGSIRVKDLAQEDILKLHRKFVGEGGKRKVASNAMLRTLRAALNKAIEWQWITVNPTKGVKLYREEPRDRPLLQHEMKALWAELEKREGNAAADAIRFILLTACRKSEALKATFDDFNDDLTKWMIPPSKTKQRRRDPKNLPTQATEILRRRREIDDFYPWLTNSGRPLLDVKHVWNSVRKDAGIEDVTIHDLRHTMATFLASTGTSLYVVGKMLGHSQPQTTARYAHLYDEAQRKEIQRYSDSIMEIVKRDDETASD